MPTLHMKLGFSTGALHKTAIPPISQEAIAAMAGTGSAAIELGCIRVERVPSLTDIQPADLASFSHVSLHLPSGDIRYQPDDFTRQLLDKVQAAHERLRFAYVVLHPDIVLDWSVLGHYALPFAIENMDDRKSFGQTVANLRSIFAEHDYKMVLDVQHAYLCDKSGQLTKDLYLAFRDRIVEIHVSGYQELHDPLYITRQDEIIQSIPDKNLPIIIEGAVASPDELVTEYNYVQDILNK